MVVLHLVVPNFDPHPNRVRLADQKTAAATKEGRILRRKSQKDALNIASAAGTLLYGPRIDDSM